MIAIFSALHLNWHNNFITMKPSENLLRRSLNNFYNKNFLHPILFIRMIINQTTKFEKRTNNTQNTCLILMLILEDLMYSRKQRSSSCDSCNSKGLISAFSLSVKIRGTPENEMTLAQGENKIISRIQWSSDSTQFCLHFDKSKNK